MKRVNMHEAKSNLSGLVREVREGAEREIIICVSGRPAAKLVSAGDQPRRELGLDRELITIAPDFDASNADIAAVFEGP